MVEFREQKAFNNFQVGTTAITVSSIITKITQIKTLIIAFREQEWGLMFYQK